MSLVYVDEARRWGKLLEDREAARSGSNVEEARKVVARRIGEAPGTLRNLRKRRLKDIGAAIYDKLRAQVIRELEAEVRHLEHELQILRATGEDPRGVEVGAVLASLETAREALGISTSRKSGITASLD